MPGYGGNNRNRNFNDDRRNFGGRNPRNDGRSNQNRIPAQRTMISPWQSGLAPGNAPSFSLMGTYQTAIQNQFLLNQATINDNNYNMPNKARRLDGGGNFDGRGGRGLFPTPNSSLMGPVPQNLAYNSRSSNVQQRLGNNWSSGKSTGGGRTDSVYYPSSRDNNSRRQSNRQSRSTRDSQSRSRYGDRKPSVKSDKDKSSVSADRDAKSPVKDESVETLEEEVKEKNEDETEKDAINEDLKNADKDDDLDTEALYCHICDLEKFQTKKGYVRHLEGLTHSRMAKKFHEKNATRLQFLTVSAKFAEMRRKDHLIRLSSCKFLPLGKIAEKIILRKNLEVEDCCNQSFSNAFDFYEHKLSVQHLEDLHEKGTPELSLKRVATNLHKASAEEIEEIINSAKDAVNATPHDVTNMTAYDPSIPCGLEHMEKVVKYKCGICNTSALSPEDHCQTQKHYDNLLAALKREEERKLEDENRREAEEAQEGKGKRKNSEDEEKDAPSQKYERRADEDCESNFSDKNEETKDFLNYDDDDDMIILDEEKNEDELNFEPETTAEEKPIDDALNDEPQTILDDMIDEPVMDDEAVDTPVIDDDIMTVGEDFEATEVAEAAPKTATEQAKQSQKILSPRRSSRVRL